MFKLILAAFFIYMTIALFALLASPASESWCEQQTIEVQRETRGCAAHDRVQGRRH